MSRLRVSRHQGRIDGVPAVAAPDDQDVVMELASTVIGRVSPDELAAPPMVAQDYFADPSGRSVRATATSRSGSGWISC